MTRSFHAKINGIAGRTIALVMGSLFTFAAVLLLLLYFGTGKILVSWNENERKGLETIIGERLLALAVDAGKTGAEVSPGDVESALADLPYSPTWIAVTDGHGTLLYFYRAAGMPGMAGMARRMLRDDSSRMHEMMNGHESSAARMSATMQGNVTWRDVRLSDGRLAFRYGAAMPEFGEKESNRVLLATARLILVWGLVAAAIVSILFALVFSRPLERQSASLVAALERMAAGERGVAIPECPVTEFGCIARASTTLQDNLVREENIRRQWAADVAHDLRTPLTVLRGQFEGMIDGVFKPEPERIVRLEKELSRLEKLVNSLALLSRIETPDFTLSKKPMDAVAFLSEVAGRFDAEAVAKGSSLIVDSRPVTILADSDLLARAIDNLVSNALRYGAVGGTIRLRCVGNAATGGVEILVENDGVIGPDILPRLFDRLFRADSSRNTEGSGLGLSIARAIVTAHGGTIRAESDEANSITRFTVSLP
jgi:two-component system sensor histidine kinase BaeS